MGKTRKSHSESKNTTTSVETEQTYCGTAALVGRPNVGKSTLLNAILGQKIAATTYKPQTTRRQLRGVETRENRQVVFVDTPGLHKPKPGLHAFMIDEALDAARAVDVVLFIVEAKTKRTGLGEEDFAAVFEPDDEAALSQLDAALAALTENERKQKQFILVINKIDTLPDKRLVLPLIAHWAQKERFADIVPVSASENDGVDILFDLVAKKMPANAFMFSADSLTDASEKDIAAELIREQIMLVLEDEIPYQIAVEVESFDESRRSDSVKPICDISAVIHVERVSQKSIVIGKGGQRIKEIGQRARGSLEKLLDCQVMLRLLVRVEENWTTNPKGMRRVGYIKKLDV